MTTFQSKPDQPSVAPPLLVRPGWKTRAGNLARRGLGRLAAGLNGLAGSRATGSRTPGSRTTGRFGILMYHRIVSDVPGFAPPFYNVQPTHFADQVTGLLKRKFQFWPLSRVLAAAERREPLPPRTVVLTFDDAYGNVYTQAWPVMKRLGVPATIFLATAYLDSDEPFPFDPWGVAHRGLVSSETYRPLKTAECREMADSGLIEFGSHTHTHQDFRGRPKMFCDDVSQSIEVLRDRFAIDRTMFCFPWGGLHNGFASDELAFAAQQAGATCGLTTETAVANHLESPFKWGRFNVFDWDTSATLAGKLGGWYLLPPARRAAKSHSHSLPAEPRSTSASAPRALIEERVT